MKPIEPRIVRLRMPRLFSLVAFLSICGAVSASSGPQTDFMISIENTMGHEMDFYYTDTSDSTAEKPLGSVPGHDIKDFTVRAPASASVTIVERGAAMPDYVARKPVILKADSLVEVAF